MAEVRGRNRPGAQPPGWAKPPPRTDHALPLTEELTAAESRIGAQMVLGALARNLGLDADSDNSPSFADELNKAADTLAQAATTAGAVADSWDSLTELIYRFDAHIQWSLAAQSDTQATDYLLGRALAECYWALDPDLPEVPQTWASWSFLLGRSRCAQIERLLGSLSAYMQPYAVSAIAGSLRVWRAVAANAEWLYGNPDCYLSPDPPRKFR